MNSNKEVLYVYTPSIYGLKLTAEHITPNKIYKGTLTKCGTYHIVDDLLELRDISLIGCAWLGCNNWHLATEEEYNKQENIMNGTKKLSRAQCLREHARVIEMCEGTDVRDYECIRINGKPVISSLINSIYPDIEYTFAIRIHEGKPVFEGDILYGNNEYIAGNAFKALASWKEDNWKCVSWTKLVKTCLLNGTELPLADGNFLDYGLNIEVYYKNKEDRNKIRNILTKLLKGEEL